MDALEIEIVISRLLKKEGRIVVFYGEDDKPSELADWPQDDRVYIRHIRDSTNTLQSYPFRGCSSLFHESCFTNGYTYSPKEFLETHYEWLSDRVGKFYGRQSDLCGFFDVEDLLQEACICLPKILSKFAGQCNLRTFVWNRLKGYLMLKLKEQYSIRLVELKAIAERLH